MGFLREQSLRLRRKRGWTADELSDEIFAIFNAEVPFDIDGPVTITNNGNDPGLTIRQNGPYDGSIKITRYPDGPINLPGLPPFLPPGLGDLTIQVIYADGRNEVTQGPPDGTQIVIVQQGAFPGKVLSGSGGTYEVAVYESGPSSDPVTRTVTQLQIQEDETIPADTWVMVGKVRGDYFMQVPVWL